MIYFEDVEPGLTQKFGSYAVTREEVLEFAGKYDPQPFHLDDEAAAKTHFGKIAASGWHTCSMTMAKMDAAIAFTQQRKIALYGKRFRNGGCAFEAKPRGGFTIGGDGIACQPRILGMDEDR